MPDNPSAPPQDLTHPEPKRHPKPDPCVMVIFGATGDLTKRLVIPALYNRSRTNALPEQFALIGVARRHETAKSWGNNLYAALQSYVGNASAAFNVDHLDAAAWTRLRAQIADISGETNGPALYANLRAALGKPGVPHNAIFYLAIADQLFGVVVEQLGKAGLTNETETRGAKKRWR